MIVTKEKIRVAISLTLVLTIASVFALHSLAASSSGGNGPRNAVSIDNAAAPFVGKLTGTGQLTIDGEVAQPGATVVSGSRIATGANGTAVIDLGTMGQIALRSMTKVDITFTNDVVSVVLDGAGTIDGSLRAGVTGKLQATGAKLRLNEGSANLRSANRTRWLRAGEAVTMTADAEAIIAGGSTFTAEGGAVVAEQQPATEQLASQPQTQNNAPTVAMSDNPSTPVASGGTTTTTEGGSSVPATTGGGSSMPTPPGGAPVPAPTPTGPTSAGIGGFAALVGIATGVAVGVTRGSRHDSPTQTVRPSTVTP